MTKVTFSKTFEKQFYKVPEYIQEKVASWIWSVRVTGLHEAQKRPGLHDEPLRGNRKGQRSVRMNKGYRLIYWIIEDQVHIELLEVNKHDY